MRIQVPTNHESTTFWRKQQGGNWSYQLTCGERRDLPPSSLTRDDDEGSSEHHSASSDSDSICHKCTESNGVGSSISDIRWEHHLPASSHELDLITSSIHGEHDILDEVLGYKVTEVLTSGGDRAIATSCGAYDVMALPATECIDSQFEHTSNLMACTLVTNVSSEAHIEPNSSCWSFISEVIPYPGRTTGRFEQFMDFVAFPEHHFTFDATKYTQSLHHVSDCIVFPERYFCWDKTLNQASLVPKKVYSSKSGCVVDEKDLSNDGQTLVMNEFEDDKNGCCPTTSPISREPMLESRRDMLDYTYSDHGVVSRYSSSPFPSHTDQTSNALTDEISPPFLEKPFDATNEADKNEISHGSCILDDVREDEDRYRETTFVTSTRSLTPYVSSVSTLSYKSKTGLKRRDCCASEMGMELVLVSKGNGHRMKKEKSLVKRFFSAVLPPSPIDRC